MFLKSIRFKVVVWYMLILATTLSGFSVVLYHNLKVLLYGDLDDLLQSRAEGIADAIDTYWETQKLEAATRGIQPETSTKTNNSTFYRIAQRWVQEKSNDPRLMGIIVRIFDVEGNTVAISKDFPHMAALPSPVLRGLLEGASRLDLFPVEYPPGKTLMVRGFTLPVIENNTVAYLIQVASPLTTLQVALGQLRGILFTLLPLTVVLTGILGVVFARVALKNVDTMVRTIHRIEATNLQLRVPVPSANDEIRRLAETFNSMLERLDAAFTSQRQFIEDLSHEVKTPLTILKGQLEVSLRKLRAPQEYERILQSALEEINTMHTMVEELLTLARFDAREIPLDMKKVEVNAVLEAVLSDMRILADQKCIRIHFQPGSRIWIEGDEKQLRRVFTNIIDNAVKYTLDQGQIAIQAIAERAMVRVEIVDTGIGIAEGDLPYIFDRFYRADKSRSGSGFGLGLSIARSIVEAHKGAITIASRLKQGTAVTIDLPGVISSD